MDHFVSVEGLHMAHLVVSAEELLCCKEIGTLSIRYVPKKPDAFAEVFEE